MFSVTIEFGGNPETQKTFPFDSEAELNAFLDGIEAGLGWVDYQVINYNREKK